MSGSEGLHPGWMYPYAFDGKVDTQFVGTGTPAWLSISLPLSIEGLVIGYQITGKPSYEYYNTQNPRDWYFQVSNDSSSWTTIDTQTGQKNHGTNFYSIPGGVQFKNYRIYITSTHPDGHEWSYQPAVREFQLCIRYSRQQFEHIQFLKLE
jgi:hypothetical protein